MIRLLYSKQYQNRQAELDYQQLIKQHRHIVYIHYFKGTFRALK